MARRGRVYIIINGILNYPGSMDGCTDKAEIWIEKHTGFKAARYEYMSGVLTRRIFQGNRVEQVAQLIAQYHHTMDVILIGHSNGCEIICKLLDKYPIWVKEIHLVAAACDRSFNDNGLNRAVLNDKVGTIYVYCSKKDGALKKAKSTGWLKYIGLGYGWLGLDGPKHMSPEADSVTVEIWDNSKDHTDWFNDENLDTTMRAIVGAL